MVVGVRVSGTELRGVDIADPIVTSGELVMPAKTHVLLRLTSNDVIHSFWIPQLAGKTDVIPGQVNESWLEARVPGESHGMCGEYCGLQHAHMALDVIAESPEQFTAWARERRAESVPPTSSDAMVGRTVFRRSCGACHAVGGTDALGRVGPDLTHLASRGHIGAGALTNTPEHLARWITNAPAVKEGSRMPAIPLDAAELRSVVAYLETLR